MTAGERIEHGYGCTSGWTAIVDRTPSAWGDRVASATLVCWSCGVTVTLAPTSPAVDRWAETARGAPWRRPETLASTADVPDEHRPQLVVDRGRTSRLPASIPPARFAGVWLHAERVLDFGSEQTVLTWLVADNDGNVLGEVWQYVGPRAATLFRWGSPSAFAAADRVAGEEGLRRRGAAVRHMLAAVLPRSDEHRGADGQEKPS